MRPALVDTDILSMFFRGNDSVVAHFELYLKQYEKINFSIITYYEIVSGMKHRSARKQLEAFLAFARQNTVLPLTERTVTASADVYADLRSKGQPLDDIDLLIAGTALAGNLVLVTNNERHFERVEGLETENWSIDGP